MQHSRCVQPCRETRIKPALDILGPWTGAEDRNPHKGESRAKVCGQRAVSRGWSSITTAGKDAPLTNGSWRAHCRILIFAPSVPFYGGNHESPTWVSLLRVGQLGSSALCRPYES